MTATAIQGFVVQNEPQARGRIPGNKECLEIRWNPARGIVTTPLALIFTAFFDEQFARRATR